jgi:hypothetical protein
LCIHRLVGDVLVARHVGDLAEIRFADQVLRISGIRARREQRHVALRLVDRVGVLGFPEVQIGAHQDRFARIVRIRMLLVDVLEGLHRIVRVAGVEARQRLVVHHVRRIDVDRRVVRLLLAPASGERQRQRGDHDARRALAARQCGSPAAHASVPSMRPSRTPP